MFKSIFANIKAQRKLFFFRKYKIIVSDKIIQEWDSFLLYILNWANQTHINIIEKKLGVDAIDNPRNYESLIPNEDADKNKKYSEALNVALQTPKVNNIAITGSYGSGKSSFLRTFEKNNNGWVYLPISLATFKDEELIQSVVLNNVNTKDSTIIVNTDDKTKDTKYEINQLIEKSILQQIFYREQEENIPNSRFKRIKNIKSYWLGLHVGLLVLLSVLGVFLYAPKYYKSLFLISELPKLNESVLLGSFFIGVLYFIYQFSKYLMNLQVSKLNLKDGEIELGNKEKTSILNEHLDEILYFFEVTSYNVIVLEDLDRFGNTEIFIKLRELNTLINNSKEIGRRVIFIYAIKDEMFKDKDRTKFFDFILPIIPYINSSNSLEKIKVKFKEETTIDQDFLSDIALYIDDMRLLVNIYNEYMIYKHKLTSDKLNKNKLLAMIIYKNLYPSDFAKLHFNAGVVSSLFNSKVDLIQKQIAKKRASIDDIEIKIQKINNELQENIAELRMIYLYKIAEKIHATHYRIDGAGEYQILGNLFNDQVFDLLSSNKNIHTYFYEYNRTYSRYEYNEKGIIEFHEIENEINEEYPYSERKQFIDDRTNNKIEILRENIEKLENEIDIIKSFSLQKLMQNTNEDIFGQNFVDKDILKLFIRDGYIDENYHDYISYFFEGSITLNDREFLLSVKNNHPLEFTYKLNKIDELVKRLKNRDFEVSAILNFDLLMYLLRDEEMSQNLEKYLKKLADESEESIKFTFEFIEHVDSFYKTKFVPALWKKFWWYVIKQSEFSQKKVDEYFELLLKNVGVDKLIELNFENTLKEYIERIDYLSGYDSHLNEKYENLINKLNVKFQFIKVINNFPLFNYIYENNHYKINIDMLNQIAFIKGAPQSEIEEKLKVAHLTTLNELVAVKKLLSYMDVNINDYIESVFLKIETNTQESEKTLFGLLNHKNISFENKVAIIEKEDTKISDISKVLEDEAIWKELFKANKIEPTWDNLLYYYQQSNDFDDVLTDFFNQEENYVELSKSKMKNEKTFTRAVLNKLSKEILVSNKITDDAYEYIVQGIWFWKYDAFSLDGLSSKKVENLLKHKKLNLNQENINQIKELFPSKLIILVEDFKTEFLEKFAEFSLESGGYAQILKSSKFTNAEKISIVEKIDLVLFDDVELVEATVEVYGNSPKKLSIELFNKIFEKSTHEFALIILAVQIPYLDKETIIKCLKDFSGSYADLAEKGASELKFENNKLNSDLLDALDKKRFISKVKHGEKVIKAIRFRK